MKDVVKYVLSNMMHRLTRSSLTILSILIGIMSIFALLSFGQGLKVFINDMAEKAGVDKIIIQESGFNPPGTGIAPFDDSDILAVRRTRGVDEVSGNVAGQAQVKAKGVNVGKYVFIFGIEPDSTQRMVEQAFTIELERGRSLQRGDTRVAVLGHNYQLPDKIFADPIDVGDKITINEQQYRVVGFFKEIGNPQDDSNIFVTNDDARSIFDQEGYSYIIVRANADQLASEVADMIKERLRRSRDQKEGQEDFMVMTFEDAIQSFSTIIVVLNGILLLIALISVVVAAVNIMNTMYTAVLERTKEIGVMKAIGAQNSTILSVFVVESGFLGLLGGILGVLLGFVVASIGGQMAAAAGYALLKPVFPWWLTFMCIAFSIMVGLLSGYFPARAAARQNPVEALRYE
jgi:putative ABC transport system permease protein